MKSWDGPPDSSFDEGSAEGYIGKYLLNGVTHVQNDGTILQLEELHGTIATATAFGVDIELRGVNEGKIWRIPPFLDELVPARSGTYALKSTGESIEDPDFIFTVTIRKPVQQ